jgi:hypothetical protein
VARLPSLRQALLRTLERNIALQSMPDGSLPHLNRRDAFSFTPDPDDWRTGRDVPANEIGMLNDVDPVGQRLEGSSADMADDVYGDMAWTPMPWTRLVNRKQLLEAERAKLATYHALIRLAAMSDEAGRARSHAPYRKLSGPRSLSRLVREMEAIRRRNRSGEG